MSLRRRSGPIDTLPWQQHIESLFFPGEDGPRLQYGEQDASQPNYAFIQETGLLYLPFIVTTVGEFLGGVDPLFEDVTNSSIVSGAALTTSTSGILGGQYDPQHQPGNFQRLYGWVNRTTRLHELEIVAPLSVIDTDPYPNFERRSGGSGVPGAPLPPDGWTSGDESRYIFFEGLTDGVPGETATGTNIYPKGLALVLACDEASEIIANDRDDLHVWVDLDTGDGVGFLTNLTTGSRFFEPVFESIGSAAVRWRRGVFYPDADSTFGEPFGFILWSPEYNSQQDSNDVPPQAYDYFKITEFNPFELQGNTSRLHGRELFRSRAKYEIDPIIAGGETQASNNVNRQIFWIPASGAFTKIVASDQSTPPVAGLQVVHAWFGIPEINIVTPPAGPGKAETGSSREVSSIIAGDLGELVVGAIASWNLQRITTIAEALATGPVAPGGNVVVANFPIDESPRFFRLFKDVTTELTEGVEYNVNRTTGTITFVSPEPVGGSVYTLTYGHFASPADPSHGTLSTTQSISDQNGRASTQIIYPENDALDQHVDFVICFADDAD